MKAFIALLASTSICCAASVGVSNDQLKASGQKVPQSEQVTKEEPNEEAYEGGETLVGHFVYDDGTEEGVDINLPLAAFPSADECQAAATKPENVKAAQEKHLTLFCKHFD